MISSELFFLVSILVLIRIEVSSCSSLGSLCKIEIFVVKNQEQREKIAFTNTDLNQTEIFSDTYYEAICLTNEQVHSRNFIYLETWNNSEQKISLNQEQLANKTLKEKNLNYLRGGFTIASSNQKLNHSLLCRFWPVNHGVYCEKKIYLNVIYKTNQNLKIFFVILSIVIFIGVINLIIKCCIMRRKRSSSNLKFVSRSSSSRSNSKANKKRETIKNGNLDFNCSIYSLDDIQVKIAQKNDSTSQVLINGQALNRV